MKVVYLLSAAVVAFGAFGLASPPAHALALRTFVSGAGSDSGGCALATPCRTFAYAITQTAPSGEIIVLSNAGYGAVTITQSVSIINTSFFAGVTVASGTGITIAAGATDVVRLVGLTIDGGGTGTAGIVFNSGRKLIIDQCDAVNFVGNGIDLNPASDAAPKISISNTRTLNNAINGINLSGSSARVQIDHVVANGNGSNGIALSGASSHNVSNSIASYNGFAGFEMTSTSVTMLDSLVAHGNADHGIYIDRGTVLFGRSVVSGNGNAGINVNTGTALSYRNNEINGNGTDINGTVNTAPQL